MAGPAFTDRAGPGRRVGKWKAHQVPVRHLGCTAQPSALDAIKGQRAGIDLRAVDVNLNAVLERQIRSIKAKVGALVRVLWVLRKEKLESLSLALVD